MADCFPPSIFVMVVIIYELVGDFPAVSNRVTGIYRDNYFAVCCIVLAENALID